MRTHSLLHRSIALLLIPSLAVDVVRGSVVSDNSTTYHVTTYHAASFSFESQALALTLSQFHNNSISARVTAIEENQVRAARISWITQGSTDEDLERIGDQYPRNRLETAVAPTTSNPGYAPDFLSMGLHPEGYGPDTLIKQPFDVETLSGIEMLFIGLGEYQSVDINRILKRYPLIKCLHVVDIRRKLLDRLFSDFLNSRDAFPIFLHHANILQLPDILTGRVELAFSSQVVVYEFFSPAQRKQAANQISRTLAPGGVHISYGENYIYGPEMHITEITPFTKRADKISLTSA